MQHHAIRHARDKTNSHDIGYDGEHRRDNTLSSCALHDKERARTHASELENDREEEKK